MKVLSRHVVPVIAILSLGCRDLSSPADRTAFGNRTSVWQPDPSAAIAHEYYSGLVDADCGAQGT